MSVSCSVVPDSLQPHGLWPTRLSVHGISQARMLEGVAIPPPGDLPDPGIEPGSPALQADSLPSKSPGKPRSHASKKSSLPKGEGLTSQIHL